MKRCMYCKKKLDDKYFENKIGYFCSEEEYDKFMESLTKEQYIELQHSICVCSDD